MLGLGDWLQMGVLGDVFCLHGESDWEATLASTFEREAELRGLIAAEMPSPAKTTWLWQEEQ